MPARSLVCSVPAVDTFPERLRSAREAAGLSQSALARAIGVKPQSIQALESGKARRTTHLLAIARILRVDPSWLESGNGALSRPAGDAAPGREVAEDRVELPPVGELPRDVPVYGVAAGGKGSWADFHFNGELIDHVRRPWGLQHAANVFAVHVIGSSMAPRYEEGDLVFVHPGRPVRIGDDVIVELHGPEGQTGDCLIKRLVRRSPSRLILAQFNPPRDDIEIAMEQVKHIYRILRTAELLGV
jgi:phage repressor protein C with HTH and peptisase S24 domain